MLKEDEIMEERSQLKGFTFFRSYYEASLDLSSDEEKLSLFNALCEYAFKGKIPNIDGPARAVFTMAKPVLDVSIKKALAGAKGGKSKKNNSGSTGEANGKQNESTGEANGKQNESKAEANGKQNESKAEANGKQNDSDKGEGKGEGNEEDGGKEYESKFELFWEAFPRKLGKLLAKKEFIQALENGIDAQVIIDAVKKQKKTNEWMKENGKYIPSPSKWLSEGRWDDELGGNSNEGSDQENNDRFGNSVLSGIYEEEKSGKNRLGEMSAG